MTVPSVVGDPAATAQQILSQAGFKVVRAHDRRAGRLHPGQRVLAESQRRDRAVGSTVTIYVAAQPTPSPTAPYTEPDPVDVDVA